MTQQAQADAPRLAAAMVGAQAEKAAMYDRLLPYLCKTCGGFGLVDRRSHDDPLGAEPCPDCNAPTPPARERKPLTDEQIDALWGGENVSVPQLVNRRAISRSIERAHGIGTPQ